MKEHRKNATTTDVLEMMVRAGLKPARELERLHADIEDDNSEQDEKDGKTKKSRVA